MDLSEVASWATDLRPSRLVSEASVIAQVAGRIPTGAEYTRKYSVNPGTKRKVAETSALVWDCLKRILDLNGTPQPQDDSVGSRLDAVTTCAEVLLRRHEKALSLVATSRKRKAEGVVQLHKAAKQAKVDEYFKEEASQADDPTAKYFKVYWNNFEFVFVPYLKEKPHALSEISDELKNAMKGKFSSELKKALKKVPSKDIDLSDARALRGIIDASLAVPRYPIKHPYEEELDALPDLWIGKDDRWGYESETLMNRLLFEVGRPVPPEPLETAAEVIMVCKDHQVLMLIDDLLETSKIVAIDVEFHQANSYRGFVCLIQVTSETGQDYIIDPQHITKEVMNLFNQVTANPAILKILHGSFWDVLWLQHDFGIFLVNTFDTFFACQELDIPGGNSLANLVNYYTGVQLDKTMQTCDWRQRPLTDRHIKYARLDTHYLVYIFQCLRNQLLARVTTAISSTIYHPNMAVTARGKKQLLQVLHKSQALCRNSVSYAPNAVQKTNRIFAKMLTKDPKVDQCLTHLLAWRDWTARKLDVASPMIASDQFLYNIALKRPRTRTDLTALGFRMSNQLIAQVPSLLAVVNSFESLEVSSTIVEIEDNVETEGVKEIVKSSDESRPESSVARVDDVRADEDVRAEEDVEIVQVVPSSRIFEKPSVVVKGAFVVGSQSAWNLQVFGGKKVAARKGGHLARTVEAMLGCPKKRRKKTKSRK